VSLADAGASPHFEIRKRLLIYNRSTRSSTEMVRPPQPRPQVADDARQTFAQLFGGPCRVFRAPGRVNLIGEHTDYNLGFVMPAAVDLYCTVAIAPRSDRELHVYSAHFGEKVIVDLESPNASPRGDWSDYVIGTAIALEDLGYELRGANLVVSGEVPLGSGLSSSAAIEVSAGAALLNICGHSVDRKQLALACQRAENEFVGARCGIMDQFISTHGRSGHALMLDCRSLDFAMLPIPSDLRLLVANTGVQHQHAAGEYNARRQQCEEGVRLLSSALPGIQSLRDVRAEQLDQNHRLLPELIYKRCRHVVTEDERVLQTADALAQGDLRSVGSLMADSHRSLRDDYEVSCTELDIMVEIAAGLRGVIGARMTGGGFGGCTVNLVDAREAESVDHELMRQYEARTGIRPDAYVLNATDGVTELP
jgi:galactokinase